jgi:hypothetical protein
MISELVTFALPKGMTREEVIEGMREVVPKWRAEPDLVRKTFLYDPQARQAGALYTWKSRAAAHAAHDEHWRAGILARYGSKPTVRYFETPLVVDNAAGAVVEEE